jgi:hypothetical protein
MSRPVIVSIAAAGILTVGCTAMRPSDEDPARVAPSAPTVHAAGLAPYLDVLSGMAPGDPVRQAATLESARSASEASPTASARLRYALALGSAGPGGSNPVEASRLLAEVLAGPNDLTSEETALARGFAREFDARVKLYADLARQREESDARAAALAYGAEQREEALAAENARLKRALAEAERKLRGVAEMERQLLEQSSEPESTPPQP